MSEDEFDALRADIASRGILTPLEITAAGVVVDGLHRLQAAQLLGLEEVPIRSVAPADEVEHILLAALNRRHLSQSQKAALAIELDEYRCAKDAARKRRTRNVGDRPEPLEVATLPPRPERSRETAAKLAGVSARTVQDVVTVRTHDHELYEQVKLGALPAHRAAQRVRQAQRHAAIGAPAPLPGGRFQLVYADPPWQLGNPDSDYAPEQYYPTLPLDHIKALPVPAAADALLYLWAVNSHLPQALEVLAAWGFEYRSCEVWVKPSIGMGVWTRNRHELLLIGRKGKASPAPRRKLLDSVIEAARGRHSEKPALLYERLEHLYPEHSKLELFARGRPRRGWTAWGNELEQAAA
jgi:N6-adenosine-specific RNA methylase IME4